jgi:hypothetical protein
MSCGQAEHEAVDRDGPDPGRPGERDADDRQHVRADQRGPDALDDAGGDQDPGARGEAAGGRGDDEHREPGREGQPPPVQVPEAPGGDEQHRAGEAVPGHHPLDGAGAGVQVSLHGRQRHVHDEEVKDDHEGPAHEHGQR